MQSSAPALALAKAGSFEHDFTEVDLNVVLNEAIETLRDKIQAKQARIESVKLPVIHGSRQMLEYLFVNLLDNAIKFQPDDNIPIIAITANNVIGNTVPGEISGHEKHFVCIDFADNGIGFAQADAIRIFGIFEKLHTRQQYKGSGIGLTISLKIAEAHGGYIEVKGIEGKGAVFTCCLAIKKNFAPACTQPMRYLPRKN